jgi:hypothetical protein
MSETSSVFPVTHCDREDALLAERLTNIGKGPTDFQLFVQAKNPGQGSTPGGLVFHKPDSIVTPALSRGPVKPERL